LTSNKKLRNATNITHRARIVARIPRRRIERKREDVLGEHPFGCCRGKGTREAIWMLRIMSEELRDCAPAL
jgi:hypothetical protein